MTDPVRIVRHLDPDRIRAELNDLDQRRAALMVLLRAARCMRPAATGPGAAAGTPPRDRKGVRP